MPVRVWLLMMVVGWAAVPAMQGSEPPQTQQMDRDLMEVTIPQLGALYAAGRYTVTEVVQWHLDRIARYNGVYRSVQTVDAEGALATAAAEDAAAKPGLLRGPVMGRAHCY